jgi:flagellar basal body-associated protein FliL
VHADRYCSEMSEDESPSVAPADRPRKPIWVYVLISLIVAAVVFTVSTVAILFAIGTTQHSSKSPGPKVDAASSGEIFEVVRLSLLVVAGLGGLVALVVTYRRQLVAEEAHARQHRISAQDQEQAISRRATELYTQAVEQLTSPLAAIRVGGMYALERLGEENEGYRQVVVDVLCAYLRTSISVTKDELAALADGFLADVTDPDVIPKEDIQVRMVAQRILTGHQRKPRLVEGAVQSLNALPKTKSYWAGIDLNLSDATLIHFDASRCTFQSVSFERSRFRGVCKFSDTTFEEPVWFDRAHFDHALFDKATFSQDVRFFEVKFHYWASFDNARFMGETTFNAATFSGVVAFRDAHWTQDPADDFLFLYAATHTNLEARVVRHWPPGWSVRPTGADSSVGELVNDQDLPEESDRD